MTFEVVDLDLGEWDRPVGVESSGLVVGVATRPLPPESAEMLHRCAIVLAPGGPDRTWVDSLASMDAIEKTYAAAPLASATVTEVLGLSSLVPTPQGLVVESLAYSMLLGGPEFASWRQGTPRRQQAALAASPVLSRRDGDRMHVTLNRPERHNAFDHTTRDALLEALAVAELDDTVSEVVLDGNGPSFCSGGDLDEFGTSPGIVQAHRIRLERSVGLAVHRLRDRVRPVLHGACIGAGIEIPAFAQRVVAHEGAYFRLPEVALGLIPGAGGTVSIARRIGRHRTAWLAMTGASLDLDTALDWGLIDGRA